MKKLILTILCITSVFFLSANGALALSITAMDSANNLASYLLGPGITISNISYTGSNAASGYFTDGLSAGIGMKEGIILTSGFASNANGVSNTSDSITGVNGAAGDSDLNALVPGYSTNDATILEFDFMSIGDSAYFNYIFASDEYNEYVNSSYNDVFGFFVNNVNYAVIPGTSTPVSVNNLNNGAYAEYYNDNDPGPYAFEYDGFTDKFTASITGLTANTNYHIKLAIADAGDYSWDSAVFLQAGTFSDTPVDPTAPVPEPSTILLMGAGLLGLVGYNRRRFSKKS